MQVKTFIRLNRAAIDATIRAACPNVGRLTDSDREDWLSNDEGLYTWALREGVPL